MATTSDTRIGDSISPVLIPTSLAAAPSSDPAQPVGVPPATTAPPRAKAPTRTYGRRVVVEDSKETDASGVEASNKALDRQSTTVVPETDFDAPVEDESHSWPKSRRSSKSGSSSPSRRSEHSTDPTTEEEAPAPKRSSMLNILDGLSSPAGSDDDDGDEEFGAVEFLKKKKTVAELLADIDREMDERDENALPAVAAAGSLSTSRDPFHAPSTKLPPTSSSLPPLTDSDIVSRHAGTSSSQQTPLAASRPSASARILDSPSEDDDDDGNAVPTARPKKASARVVHDSDDDDDEQVAPARPPTTAKRSAVPDSSEHDDEASSPVRASSAAPTLSKQERVRALAAKKKAAAGSPPPARKAAPLFEESSDEDESKRRKKGKTAAEKKSKTKALSKKVEEEMNRTTAAFARGQEARLAPSIKTKLTVQDMLRNHGPRQPSVAPYPIPRATHPDIVTLTSSDPIVGTSSSPSSHCPAQPSSKALGKRRETSPIVEATPVPRRTLQIIRPPAWGKAAKTAEREQPAEEDDEELLPLAEMLEKRQKEKEKAEARKKEQAEKRRLRSEAIKAARAKALEDDDSDLDIEGAPAALRTSTNKSKADPFRSAAATPRPPNELNHIMRDFAHIDPNHHPSDDEPTDSQFRAAGKEFGRNLDPKFRFVPSPANSKKKRSTLSAAPAPITLETLSHSLMSKTRQQNVQTRLKKVTKHQRQQKELAKPELGAVDVKAMMEKKKLEKDEDEQMDDAEDGDYYEEEEEEEAEATDSDLAAGSGSDVPVGRDGREGGEDKQEEDEGEVDSDGELVMPPSSQNSDRLGRVALAQDEDEDEEDEDAPVVRRNIGGKVRLADDEDEEEGAQGDSATLPATEVATTAAAADAVEHAPARVALPGFLDAAGDGGFSQFFNSQFSQDAGAGNDVEGFGFRRAPEPSAFGPPAPTMLAPVPLISTAERAADAALLEARGGFHEVEPGTPREAVAPRQYINKQGFMTQTRPANLFADSPSDSPRDARSFASLSTSDSQSQLITQTQFDVTQTPTQAARDKTNLRRLGALVGYESYSALAATEVQPDPTEVAMTDAQDGETQEEESFPSTAQPTAAAKDAFSALREGARRSELAPIPEKSKARTEKNAFVDDQAGLSDEEGMGLGAPSGDEDEDGHDAELESLVDNEEVDRDVADEQDKLARERYAEDLEKQEQANLLRAQGIVAGKERQKRKGLDLDDDDFDDEYIGQRGHREKKVRVDTLTTAQLQANEETQAFAVQLTETYVVKPKDGDYNFLEESQEFSDAGDDDDDAGVARDVFAAEEDDDDDLQPLAVKMSVHDARAEMLRRQQELDEADDDRAEREPSLDIDIHLGNSSSPVAPLKLNNRIQASKTVVVQSAQVDEYEDIDSQYSYFRQESHQAFVQYKASDSKDESQSGNGAPAGARSSVTSFKRSVPGASKASSTSALGGKSARTGGPALAAKPSKLKGMRKGGFA